MTIEEYKNKIKELEEKHRIEKQNTTRFFVNKNNPFKIGDILTDGESIIKYLTTSIYIGFDGIPTPVYNGTELTKKLLPTKRGNTVKLFHNVNKIDKKATE